MIKKAGLVVFILHLGLLPLLEKVAAKIAMILVLRRAYRVKGTNVCFAGLSLKYF
jgi:hypothetical protein